MLYIPKIDDYLKVVTDEEVKGFVAINSNILNQQNTKNCILN